MPDVRKLLVICSCAGALAAQDDGRRSSATLDEIEFATATGISSSSGAVLEWTTARSRASSRSLTWFRVDSDLETMLGVPESEAFLELRANDGTPLADDVGDVQGVSGLDADDSEQLHESGLSKRFAGERLRLRLGVLDANSEFAALPTASNFFNASAGTSPTILDLPTWPETAPGIELSAQLGAGVTVGGGVYGKTSTFSIGEIGFAWSPPPGRLAIGFWNSGTSGTHGVYVLAEQQMWRESREPDDEQGVYAFALYGRADDEVVDAGQHLLCGLTWRGALPRRDDDEVGVLLSRVDLSGAADEITVEAYYKAQLSRALAVQVGGQHVHQPSGDRSTEDVVALGARLEVAF